MSISKCFDFFFKSSQIVCPVANLQSKGIKQNISNSLKINTGRVNTGTVDIKRDVLCIFFKTH